jgi:hypothetical protein
VHFFSVKVWECLNYFIHAGRRYYVRARLT